ncbi:MAG: 50S ribosomal protein L21e [Nanoarchaeota archaeon]|nr:50S ribosomal protein L21e [Nanoarchaeota archaeon]
MVTRKGGARRKSRYKMKKPIRRKGKISITSYFQEFNKGDSVVLKAEPAVQKGMYCLRFHGRQGIVSKQIGKCYEVAIKDHDKAKTVIVHPVHLKRV